MAHSGYQKNAPTSRFETLSLSLILRSENVIEDYNFLENVSKEQIYPLWIYAVQTFAITKIKTAGSKSTVALKPHPTFHPEAVELHVHVFCYFPTWGLISLSACLTPGAGI